MQRALVCAPTSAEVLVAAGEVAARRGDIDQAIAYYDRVPDDGRNHSIVGIGAAGDLLIESHRMSEAELRFRRILSVDPHHVLANRRLAALLVMAGRRRESIPFLFELVRLEECDADELALLGNVTQVFDDEKLIGQFQRAAPDDPLPALAAARIAMEKSDLETGARLLRGLVRSAPDLDEARINLGKIIADAGSATEFVEWNQSLPKDAQQNPDVWVIRGQFAERRREADVAIRCYWEAVRQDPTLWQANYQLAWLLTARGDERAGIFLERSKNLKTLTDALRQILLKGVTAELALQCGTLTEGMGRLWEAHAWYRIASRIEPGLDSAQARHRELEKALNGRTPLSLPSANPALSLDFSSFPLPSWKAPDTGGNPPVAARNRHALFRFADVAEAVGMRFTYENGDDRDVPGMRTWQSFGGGVAVLDFDADGWPDLYFTQGGDLPVPSGRRQPVDQLFRNLGGGRFADVTPQSRLSDPGYGQGMAAGDYNNDGFPDLYVANIGTNHLYRNNGDGTFADATAGSGILRDHRWNASCVVADLNGDGLPDLFDVTYLAGRKPFEHVCDDADIHEFRICPPQIFDGEQDRLYVNLGDGTFQDVTAAAGILAPEGKGLGVVAADFENAGRLNLFISNDMTLNFYFVNETPAPGAPPQFREGAIVTGCAYNSAGRSQACMGIATADADGDGLFDLYITNFYNQYNILYVQRPGGLFVDGTSEAGLKTGSVPVLGFGTQFLDADLDGWPDVVVANGHVDDYRKKGIPFRMRPQFYANLGQGRFAEVPAEKLGAYFETESLGRGLARLDWNRDGLEDFVVSHLDSPAALVTNETSPAGHFLALQLRGVQSSRDAVGAIVWVNAAGRKLMQQITAGDGYYASNQKQLIFGLGECDKIAELQVRWPSGLLQRFEDVSADQELLLIEGSAKLHRQPAAR